MTDKELDEQCYELLREVDKLRAQLRVLEPQLTRACIAYGKRRGCNLFRDFHVRNDMQRLGITEDAA